MEKLYNGVNHAYMTYFVDAIFQLLNSIDDGDGFEWKRQIVRLLIN